MSKFVMVGGFIRAALTASPIAANVLENLDSKDEARFLDTLEAYEDRWAQEICAEFGVGGLRRLLTSYLTATGLSGDEHAARKRDFNLRIADDPECVDQVLTLFGGFKAYEEPDPTQFLLGMDERLRRWRASGTD